MKTTSEWPQSGPGFTAGYDAAMLGPVIAAKLTGGVLAVLAALLFTRKKPAQNM